MWRELRVPLDRPETLLNVRERFASHMDAARHAGMPLHCLAVFAQFFEQETVLYATPHAARFAHAADGWRRCQVPLITDRLTMLCGHRDTWDLILLPASTEAA